MSREVWLRWRMLALSLAAWAAGATAVYQLALLLPRLRAELHLSVGAAGTLVGIANGGLALGMLGWGVAADRYGERRVMAGGLVLCGLSVIAAAAADSVWLLAGSLAVTGLAAGSVYAPSGRLVLSWFPVRQHGLAMSVTQTSTPLASALAAATLPGMAAAHGFRPVLLLMAGACLLVAVLMALFARVAPAGTRETARAAGPHPVRPRSGLRRMYAVSVLLFVPQMSLMTFTVSYLVDHAGWSAIDAGAALGAALLLTVVTRPVFGHLSDRLGRRLGVMRGLAILNTGVLGALAFLASGPPGAVVVLIAVTSVITGSGLIATAVAEFAEPGRTGRALGVMNTLQGGIGVLAPAVLGGTIGFAGYPAAFAAIAVMPLLAVLVMPVAAERLRAPEPEPVSQQ